MSGLRSCVSLPSGKIREKHSNRAPISILKAFYFSYLRSLCRRILREAGREAKRPAEGGSRGNHQGSSECSILAAPGRGYEDTGLITWFCGAPKASDRGWSRLNGDELARVHDAVGIEGAFDPAHQLDLDRRFVVDDLVELEPADAVLGADRARELAHDAVDDVVKLLPPRQISMPVGTFRLGQVEV